MRVALRIALWCIVVIVLGAIGFLAYADYSTRPTVMGEVIPRDEDAATSRAILDAMRLVNATHDQRYKTEGDNLYRRDVHAKMQGMLKARVVVKTNLPEQYRYGIFKQPPAGGYHAWIRFSNGDPKVQSDTQHDAHGMSLKLMGVPGRKLLDGEEDAPTQDFVMTNYPVFPVSNIEEYETLVHGVAEGQLFGYFFGGPSLNLWKWHPRELWITVRTLGLIPPSLPSSPLNLQYYSQSAYRLGPNQYVKISAKPCAILPKPADVDRSRPDFLREAMKKQLQKSEGCFDLLVQRQDPGKNMPIEDPTIQWSEKDSPFYPVARITIEQGDAFDTPQRNALAENLSFMPWHALPDHEPVGALNRLRKAVYQQISRYRRAKNGVCFFEPADWDQKPPAPPCPPGADR